EVWKLDYTLPPGTAAGVWAKGFPERLNADNIQLVSLGVKTVDPRQLRQIAVKVEIKGTAGVQSIPVPLHLGWARLEQSVDWQKIGTLTEVVAVIDHSGAGEPAGGTLYLDVRFDRLTLLRKLSLFPAARVAGVLLLSVLGAFLVALLTRWSS